MKPADVLMTRAGTAAQAEPRQSSERRQCATACPEDETDAQKDFPC